MPDEFRGTPVLDDKGNSLYVGGVDFGNDVAQSIHRSAALSSFHSDVEEGEGTDDSIEPVNNSEKLDERDEHDGVDLPCEAWLVERGKYVLVYFCCCSCLGLVIIGHQWQQERWKVLLQLRQFGINDE
ncbi:hypothetical protein CASFOL_002295 [Castilleja foliolosa]|uniref:Uncharacterized protein n=1 Tax=Castilleja foliolosa TaxID=1961234 RepID=A0ABD3EHG3_9LAMI